MDKVYIILEDGADEPVSVHKTREGAETMLLELADEIVNFGPAWIEEFELND